LYGLSFDLESGLDALLWLKAAVMGLVEGITEFLPISSTGHLIIAGTWLDFHTDTAKVFDIAIQTGAIFAVILIYWNRLWSVIKTLDRDPTSRQLVINVLIGFFPAVLLGLSLGAWIQSQLFNAQVVAWALIVGGVIIWWVEKRLQQHVRVAEVDHMSWRDALKIGLIQCLAMIPGTSRSGATIIGGMWLGISRRAATDYSFFLAIPTLIGAGVYSLYKHRALLTLQDVPTFGIGLVVSFLSAWWCVRWLLRYVSTHSFTPFAWYRVAFGSFILLSDALGWGLWSHGA
jgi:undecaprenyl-diphosphatase